MEFISGLVSRKGRELGIPTPGNDAVVEIDRKINEGTLPMDRTNFELLRERIRARKSGNEGPPKKRNEGPLKKP
jgi:hypothetical protein